MNTEEFLSRLRSDYDFWAESLFKIRDKGNQLVPLITNEVQRAIGAAEKEDLETKGESRLYVLKARQGGVSTDQQARSLHKVWSTPGAVALTLAHSREDTDKLFQITRRAVTNFDRALLPTLGRGESKEITFPKLDSAFWTGTAGARRVGRGITLARFHGSEFAFWEDPRGVLANITPALLPRGSVAVLETTPDQYDSEAHKFWRESKEGLTGYKALFFPWWMCDRKNYRIPLISEDELGTLTPEEQSLVETHHLDHEQIAWRRKMIKELTRSKFLREYPEDDETCWITAGNKFYDSDIIEVLLRKTPTPIKTDHGGMIKVFADRAYKSELGIIYEDVIIGVDVAEGSTTGQTDRSAWTARSFPSWRLLSQFSSSSTEPDELAYMLWKWGLNEYGEALLVIEKNFHGITVLRGLRDRLKYPRRSIYHRTPLGMDYDERTDYIGWVTNGESKPLMLDYGRQILGAASVGMIGPPSREMLIDALAVTDGVLNGRDILVSEMLAWAGREYQVRKRVKVMKPLHYSG